MIENKKQFEQYLNDMLDESSEAKNKRLNIYIKYGGVNSSSKVKYILEKVGPYLYTLISKLENQNEKKDNTEVINEIRDCFKGMLNILKVPDQVEVFKNQFNDLLNFEDSFDKIYKDLNNYHKNICKFTTHMFTSLISNMEDNIAPDLLDLQELITSQEVYDYVVKKESSITTDESNIGRLIISALNTQLSSVNTEIVGRVFAYVKSGYAKADLYDNLTHSDKNSAKELSDILKEIIKNPSIALKENDVEVRDKNLATIFTKRLNEISVRLVYDKKNQTCEAKNSALIIDKCNGNSEADIVIPNFENKSKLTIVYCTANPHLYFTKDNENSWSVLSHNKINNNYLKNKTINEILSNTYIGDTDDFNKKISEFDVINISPSIMGGKDLKLGDAFKKTAFDRKEISLISNFPIFRIITKYKPDDPNGTPATFDDIFNISQNILLNNRDSTNIWGSGVQQAKFLSPSNLKKYFYNNMLLPYLQDIWKIIESKELREDFVIVNFSEGNVLGKSLYFIKELPQMIDHLASKVMSDKTLLNKDNLEEFNSLCDKLLNHKTYNSEKSKVTTEDILINIKMKKNEIQNILDSSNPSKIFKRKK